VSLVVREVRMVGDRCSRCPMYTVKPRPLVIMKWCIDTEVGFLNVFRYMQIIVRLKLRHLYKEQKLLLI
jgi:hypothetical protein